jgi:hypothetical protein
MNVAAISGKTVSNHGVSIICEHDAAKAWLDSHRNQFVVLMSFFANKTKKRFANLVAYGFNNQVIWTAALPPGSGADCYTDAELLADRDDEISAYSFSGYRCVIDLSNGRIRNCCFTK